MQRRAVNASNSPRVPNRGGAVQRNRSFVLSSSHHEQFRQLCLQSKDIFSQQPNLLELDAPIKICDSEDLMGSKTLVVSETECSKKDIETVIDELCGNVFDEQPVLTWLGGTDSRTTMEDSRVFPGRTVNQCDEASARQDEIEIHSPAIASTIDQYADASERRDGAAVQSTTVSANGDVVVEKIQSLPFQKEDSLMWELIESKDVFKIMPQKPHFRPLENCDEDLREGLALGIMVNFAKLVKRTWKLQYSDPKSKFDRSLKTLSDLKTHGFDVESLQTHLKEMLLNKERLEHLQDELKDVERITMNKNVAINEIEEEIKESEEKLKEVKERLKLARAEKERVELDANFLKSKKALILEDIRKVELNFEKLAASPGKGMSEHP